MYLTRNIEKRFLELNKSFKVLLITGPRQVGKTTMLKNIKEKERNYISLDELEVRTLAKDDPKLFLQTYKPPLIIDEIQYAPELLPYIKSMVDNTEETGLYWLTGSQQFQLMKNITESLAGRIGILEMNSLSICEKKKLNAKVFQTENIKLGYQLDISELFEQIFMGGMPNYYLNRFEREAYFSTYIKTYLERDVRDLTQVGDLTSFHKFLVSVASRTGEVLNYSSIATDAEISVNTVKSWLSILVATGIIYLLEPYHNLELKRAIKNPKIYFMDTGLCSYLCKWSSPETLMNSSVSGHYLETFVISELIKNYKNSGNNMGIYYYRDKDGIEVDLVLFENDTLYPLEIKKAANPSKDMIKHFKILEKTKKKIGIGGIICLYPDILPLDEKNYIIPISCIF